MFARILGVVSIKYVDTGFLSSLLDCDTVENSRISNWLVTIEKQQINSFTLYLINILFWYRSRRLKYTPGVLLSTFYKVNKPKFNRNHSKTVIFTVN